MAEAAKTKVYFGNLQKRTGQFGDFFTGSLKLETLTAHVSEKGYVPVIINALKNPDQYGNTHYVALNDYKKPTDSEDAPAPKAKPKAKKEEDVQEDEDETPTRRVRDEDSVNIEDIPF